MNIKEFTKFANSERLNNKNEWVFINTKIHESGYKNSLDIKYKAFDTWIQVLSVNGKKLSNTMNMSITDYKNWLNKNLSLEMIFNNDDTNILGG